MLLEEKGNGSSVRGDLSDGLDSEAGATEGGTKAISCPSPKISSGAAATGLRRHRGCSESAGRLGRRRRQHSAEVADNVGRVFEHSCGQYKVEGLLLFGDSAIRTEYVVDVGVCLPCPLFYTWRLGRALGRARRRCHSPGYRGTRCSGGLREPALDSDKCRYIASPWQGSFELPQVLSAKNDRVVAHAGRSLSLFVSCRLPRRPKKLVGVGA